MKKIDEKHLLGMTRKAIEDFDLISDGDKIAIGISGGKDSLTLAYALSRLRMFIGRKFELIGIMIDLGFDDIDKNKQNEVAKFIDNLGFNLDIVKTDISKIVFDIRKEKNPCSLCANMRRGAINIRAKELGCNKIALGHNADDYIETYLMSYFYEGRLHQMSPKTYLTRMEIGVIRPMIYVEEKDVKRFSRDFPILKNPCPADGNTKRQYIKDLITSIRSDIPEVKRNMKAALIRNIKENFQNEEK